MFFQDFRPFLSSSLLDQDNRANERSHQTHTDFWKLNIQRFIYWQNLGNPSDRLRKFSLKLGVWGEGNVAGVPSDAGAKFNGMAVSVPVDMYHSQLQNC